MRIFVTAISKGVAAVGILLLNAVLARVMAAADVGIFVMGLALLVGLTTLAKGGLDTAALRHLAIEYKRTDRRSYRAAERAVYARVLRFGVYTTAAAEILYLLVAPAFGIAAEPAVTVFIALVPLYTVVYLQGAQLKAVDLPQCAPLFETAGVSTLAGVVIGVAHAVGNDVSPLAAVGAYAACTALTAGVGRAILHRRGVASSARAPDALGGAPIDLSWSVTRGYFYNSALTWVIQWSVVLLVGAVMSRQEAAYYSIAHRMSYAVMFVLLVFTSVLSPLYAVLHERRQREEIGTLLRNSSTAICLIAGAIVLLFFVYGDDLLVALFGADYVAAYAALLILSLGQFVNASAGSNTAVLNMTGHQDTVKSAMIVAVVIIGGATPWLGAAHGAAGAAAAVATALICQNIVLSFHVYRKLGILYGPFYLRVRKSPTAE
jgi:O-antigen/teichoic acid export membrane protein